MIDYMTTLKSIKIYQEAYDKLQKIKKETGASFVYLLSKAIELLSQSKKQKENI